MCMLQNHHGTNTNTNATNTNTVALHVKASRLPLPGGLPDTQHSHPCVSVLQRSCTSGTRVLMSPAVQSNMLQHLGSTMRCRRTH